MKYEKLKQEVEKNVSKFSETDDLFYLMEAYFALKGIFNLTDFPFESYVKYRDKN